MRLVRYRTAEDAHAAVGVLSEEGIHACNHWDMVECISAGRPPEPTGPVVTTARLLAPLPNPGKMLFLGRTFSRYRADIPPEAPPFVYSRVPSSIIGPEEPIRLPRPDAQVLYEGELLVVIGRTGRRIIAADAMAHVFGYTQVNDVTWIDWLPHGGGEAGLPQISMSKNADTFCPMGPYLLTADELDPAAVPFTVTVNGELRTSANTEQLVWKLPEVIEFLSADTTLYPGDVIALGTPDAQPMRSGDEVVVEFDGLGALRNPVVQGW